MKVYVVTSGEYSDYQIRAIFSTREWAEAHIPKVVAVEEYWNSERVEVWEVDEEADIVPVLRWSVRINLISGDITQECQETVLAAPHERSVSATRYTDAIIAYSYVGPEHARELAVEARQQELRAVGATEI